MAETITVTQLNNRVKALFNGCPAVTDIWVTGEISNLKKYPSGHYYFTLKDQGSKIQGVLFAHSRSRMDFEPTENMKVSAFGKVDMYVQNGSYQFVVETMRKSGVGDLYLRFEELKRKLKEEGLFDESRKRPLPLYPRNIGVVTSSSGAVIHDIITTSASRFPANILLAPAMVQGEGAAATIVAGIMALNRQDVDVIIVGRGGGSIEDLWPFNEEIVARAIAASKVPIVSAVGHETDYTIADFVADKRAPTPTGAAAVILRDRSEIINELESFSRRLDRSMESRVREMRSCFSVLDAKLSMERALDTIDRSSMQVDELYMRAERSLRDKLSEMKGRYSLADAKLNPSTALERIRGLNDRVSTDLRLIQSKVTMSLEASSEKVESLSRHLESVNPDNVLKRGYSMVTDEDGRVLTSVKDVSVGSELRIRMRDGTVGSVVKDKEMKE